MSDFLLDLRRSLAHKGFAKILYISTGMPAVFANPYASRSQHISSQKIAQLRYEKILKLCEEYGVQVVANSAEALGAKYQKSAVSGQEKTEVRGRMSEVRERNYGMNG